jgi:hypothetical protein
MPDNLALLGLVVINLEPDFLIQIDFQDELVFPEDVFAGAPEHVVLVAIGCGAFSEIVANGLDTEFSDYLEDVITGEKARQLQDDASNEGCCEDSDGKLRRGQPVRSVLRQPDAEPGAATPNVDAGVRADRS